MTTSKELLDDLRMWLYPGTQTPQAQINQKFLHIFEFLVTGVITEDAPDANNAEAEAAREYALNKRITDLENRLKETQERLARFSAFDGDGDGHPGGSKKRTPKDGE